VGFGVRLNGYIERRRFEEAERQASAGWARLRSPVQAG
jgi:predicted metal-dependent hydrolase